MVLRIPLGKIIVCLIAFIHSLFLYHGIESTINEDKYFARDEDLQHEENVEAIFLYGLHFILIFLLIYSAYKNTPSFLLPWLLVTFPLFLYMTFMVLRGLKDMRWYLIDELFFNFCYVGFCWMFWTATYLIFKTADFRNPISDTFCSCMIFFMKRDVKRLLNN